MNEQNINNGMNGGPGMPPPPPQGYMNMNARPPQRRNPAVSPNRFRMFGIPVLVYAIICAACLYSNWSSAFDSINSVYQYMHGTI